MQTEGDIEDTGGVITNGHGASSERQTDKASDKSYMATMQEPEDADKDKEGEGGGEKESGEKGEESDDEESDDEESSNIRSRSPVQANHDTGNNLASSPAVATSTNLATLDDVATFGTASPLQLTNQHNGNVATPTSVASLIDNAIPATTTTWPSHAGIATSTQSYLPIPNPYHAPTQISSAAMMPSSESFWSGDGVASSFPISFSDLLTNSSFDMPVSMNWNSWPPYHPPGLDLSASGFTPSASPLPLSPARVGNMPAVSLGLSGHSLADSGTVPSYSQACMGYQSPKFNFQGVELASQQVAMLPPVPPTEASGNSALATVLVPLAPSPPKPPTKPGVVNHPQQLSTSCIPTEETIGVSPERPKRKHIPSQRAQRDNAIGKENDVLPAPASKGPGASNLKKARKRVMHEYGIGGQGAAKYVQLH